jgi:8-oxo-dGTP diphosphatase
MEQRTTARIVVINNEDKVLLLKMHNSGKSFWLTPGGKIEDGETPLQAAQRELFEETGITHAKFTIPHEWYIEHVGICDGKQTIFKEHIFLAHLANATVHFNNLVDYEKEELINFAWWDVREFKEHNETLRPQSFIDELITFIYPNQKLTQQNIPSKLENI